MSLDGGKCFMSIYFTHHLLGVRDVMKIERSTPNRGTKRPRDDEEEELKMRRRQAGARERGRYREEEMTVVEEADDDKKRLLQIIDREALQQQLIGRKVSDKMVCKSHEKEVVISEEEILWTEIVAFVPLHQEEPLDESSVKKMILTFEKRSYKNQELRIKFPDNPEKFMESELDLNDIIQEMHVVATMPDLYHLLVELNAVQSLLGLLGHDNTDILSDLLLKSRRTCKVVLLDFVKNYCGNWKIKTRQFFLGQQGSIELEQFGSENAKVEQTAAHHITPEAVVDLLQELTDIDTLHESEEGAEVLIDALGRVLRMPVRDASFCGNEEEGAIPSDDGEAPGGAAELQVDGQVVALLVQNLERLDESVKEEADGVHNTLGKGEGGQHSLSFSVFVLGGLNATLPPQLCIHSLRGHLVILYLAIGKADVGERMRKKMGAIVENMAEFRPEMCTEAAQQGLLQWLLKRLKVPEILVLMKNWSWGRKQGPLIFFLISPISPQAKMPFDANKLYCSEVLAILLQDNDENRELLGELDGIDVLLQQLSVFKRHNPSTAEEQEMMENLFDSLCSCLMLSSNRERFLKGEGLQLMNLMLRYASEKKISRSSALKVLDHAMIGPEGTDNCHKFVDILGLRTIFPLFMKSPRKIKKVGTTEKEHEAEALESGGRVRGAQQLVRLQEPKGGHRC
ncbi:Beta-catenin-like protein 1 [Camelus dromedarius]|uniref:Beta-catenin-like protein 1 n=1 Tax=Camelus dromedarius TaxID=9838 RepID=A0A5N4CU69_CAMDR|nr:Beta-catenin-like protein 1 [Camelus dromedarius]